MNPSGLQDVGTAIAIVALIPPFKPRNPGRAFRPLDFQASLSGHTGFDDEDPDAAGLLLARLDKDVMSGIGFIRQAIWHRPPRSRIAREGREEPAQYGDCDSFRTHVPEVLKNWKSQTQTPKTHGWPEGNVTRPNGLPITNYTEV